LLGTGVAAIIALVGGTIVYGAHKLTLGLRMNPENEYAGADLSIHHVSATPDSGKTW
jgi:Amt family ammonium transporter